MGQDDELLTEYQLYLSQGIDKSSRCKNYQRLFLVHMADNITGDIRAAWQTGTPLMNDRFKEQVEKVLNTKVGYAKRGRPKKRE